MKKEMLNGTPVPYDLPIEDLKEMMASSLMKDFTLACEALSYKNDPEAYKIIKAYINDRDKYRRLFVLKTIFRYPEAVELVGYLENAIASDDFLFVSNGLMIAIEYGIKVSEPLLIAAAKKYCDELYTALDALRLLTISESNFEEIKSVFTSCTKSAEKEISGRILCDGYLPQKAKELFELFRHDKFAKIRTIALEIGNKYDFDTGDFLSDIDGHIRKRAK